MRKWLYSEAIIITLWAIIHVTNSNMLKGSNAILVIQGKKSLKWTWNHSFTIHHSTFLRNASWKLLNVKTLKKNRNFGQRTVHLTKWHHYVLMSFIPPVNTESLNIAHDSQDHIKMFVFKHTESFLQQNLVFQQCQATINKFDAFLAKHQHFTLTFTLTSTATT